jgi:hypothetical protein
MSKHFKAATSIRRTSYPFSETPEELIKVSDSDREILRRLADRKMEIAINPTNLERKDSWYNHNGLNISRPMVLAEIQGCLDELFNAEHLKFECVHPWAQILELTMKREIYEFDVLKDDHVVEPWFNVNWIVNTTNHVDDSEVHIHLADTGEQIGSRSWDPPIMDISEDFHKLKSREYILDRSGTGILKEGLERLIGDIVPVRIRGSFWWSLGMTWTAVDLIGLTNIMLFMYDDPEGLHRIMQFLYDDYTSYAVWLEKEGLLTLNNENDYIGSGSMGYSSELPMGDVTGGQKAKLTSGSDPVSRKDLWALVESQETVGVGPDQFEEFVFPYQKKMAEQYGFSYYGCCEPLDARWHIVKKISNLRSVAVSPWADQEFMADALSKNYVYSRKPMPTLISTGNFDEEAIRSDIRNTLDIARGCNIELIMKDIHTMDGKPERLARWVEITREEIEKG